MANDVVGFARQHAILSTASNTRKAAKAIAEQTAVLAGMQAELAHLRDIEVQRQRALEFENQLRNIIFEHETRLKNVRRLLDKAPVAVHFATTFIQRQVRKLSVSAESFQQFADKDRFRQFEETIQQNLDDSTQRMTAEEQAQSQDATTVSEWISLADELAELYNAKKEHREFTSRMPVEGQERKLKGVIATVVMLVVGVILIIVPLGCASWLGYPLAALGLIGLIVNLIGDGITKEDRARAAELQARTKPGRFSELTTAFEALDGRGKSPDDLAALKEELEDRLRGVLIMSRNGEPIDNPLG